MTPHSILQAGQGRIAGEHYLATTPETAHWGFLPTDQNRPVLSLNSGGTVTVDTVSHEGLLPDQGQDPTGFFKSFGVEEVLDDAVAIAHQMDLPEGAGPHVVTGPIHVEGAAPGDLLQVDVLDLARRVPYGVISNRHGRGALPGEHPANGTTVSHFSWVEPHGSGEVGLIDAGEGRTVQFPLAPFLGLMGTTPYTPSPLSTIPPGEFGGNIDIKHAVTGSSVYLPVMTQGAGFFTGDPHFAQGNGEVALTALEASLRATLRLTVIPREERQGVLGGACGPVVETPTHWIPTGLDQDLNEAMRKATRHALALLHQRFEVPESVALAYLSAAADFEVSQVVDGVKGIHCMISKADWKAWV